MNKPSRLILRRVTEVTGATVARAIGKNEAKISKFITNTEGLMFEDFDSFFQSLGLEVNEVSPENILIQRSELESLRTLARGYLSQPVDLKTRAEDKSEA